MSWKITLDDGSKHDVEVRIKYESGREKKIHSGVLIGDLDILVIAATDQSVLLEGSTGETKPISVRQEQQDYCFYPRSA